MKYPRKNVKVFVFAFPSVIIILNGLSDSFCTIWMKIVKAWFILY